MKALVVGGTGFIGSWLVKTLLDAGNDVKVLDLGRRLLACKNNRRLEFIEGSMLDRELVEKTVNGIDVLYHLAHWPSAGHEVYDPFRFQETLDEFTQNITGTAYLLESSRKHRVKHFIYTSSAVAYGIHEDRSLNEEDCCHPENTTIGGEIYGITKLAAERFCLLYNIHLGLHVTILRLHGVYRPDRFHLTELVHRALEGKTIQVAEGTGGQYAHIEDVVQAYLLVTLNEKAYGQTFNIAGPEELDELELARFIIEKTAPNSRIELVSDSTNRMISVDISKARRLLNYNPTRGKKAFEEIIENYIKSLKVHALS